MTDQTQLVKFSFNDNSLTFYSFRGRPCVIAADVGRALGYSDDGKKLVDTITQNWLDEMIEGTDYMVLTNDDLREFKSQMGDTHETEVSSNVVYAARLMILFEPGVDLVCIKTEKPLGKKLRRYIVDNVLPKLRRGEPVDALGEIRRQTAPILADLEETKRRQAQIEAEFREFRMALAPKTDSKDDVRGLMDAIEVAIAKAPCSTVSVKEAIALNLQLLRYAKTTTALNTLLKKYRGWIIDGRCIMGAKDETGPTQWWVTRQPE